MDFLHRLWEVVARQAQDAPVPSLVHQDLPLAIRVLRDLVNPDTQRVRIDDERACGQLREFAASVMPELAGRIELYPGPRPIFDLYGIEDEIQKALARKVELKSGGYLVIDQTEALTSIDVNTGGYVGHRNLEDTIFRTNLEAAVAIARQLRLRNLGGIIIIDFIDMLEEAHRRQVLEALTTALDGDHCPAPGRRGVAAGARADDAEKNPGKPGTPPVRALSNLRGPGTRQDAPRPSATRSSARSSGSTRSSVSRSWSFSRTRKSSSCCWTRSRPASPNSRN